MNYKKLLEKYIQYIDDNEGTNYISEVKKIYSEVNFTKEEWKELLNLSNNKKYIFNYEN